jgi:hypothetical protein
MALVLALLLLTGWGQVHRVLHPATAVPVLAAAADAAKTPDAGTAKAPLAGHEEGSGLCQLLDHLSQGSAPAPVLAALAAMPLPLLQATWTPRSRHGVALAPFEARGPPHLA